MGVVSLSLSWLSTCCCPPPTPLWGPPDHDRKLNTHRIPPALRAQGALHQHRQVCQPLPQRLIMGFVVVGGGGEGRERVAQEAAGEGCREGRCRGVCVFV